jgi:hypothetical protein
MATSNRLKPDPKSRKALKDLCQRGILRREEVGIRNIIRAETGEIEPVGFSHYWFHDTWERLPNFHPNVPRQTAWVSYNQQRAEITVTCGNKEWYGTPYDLSAIFPVNTLADRLLRQPDTSRISSLDPGVSCYGSAILVTDNKFHYTFSNWKADAEDIELFDAMLSTPREVLRWSANLNPMIFFHEEPNYIDLVALKMRWA